MPDRPDAATWAKWIDSCHCVTIYLPEPGPCDGWLQHRKCDTLASALLTLHAQAVAAAEQELDAGVRVFQELSEEHAELRRRCRAIFGRAGIASNPGWGPSDFLNAFSEVDRQLSQQQNAVARAVREERLACALDIEHATFHFQSDPPILVTVELIERFLARLAMQLRARGPQEGTE